MPRKDGTGPDGKGPKKVNQGKPTPRRDGKGRGGGRRGGNKQITGFTQVRGPPYYIVVKSNTNYII